MNAAGLMLTTAVLFFGPRQPDKDAPVEEMRKLQGTWKVVHGEHNGSGLPPETLRTFKVTIVEKQYRFVPPLGSGEEVVGEISLNAKKSPKEINVAFPIKAEQGIYMFVGQLLIVVFKTDGERAKTFDSPKGSLHVLYVFKQEAAR